VLREDDLPGLQCCVGCSGETTTSGARMLVTRMFFPACDRPGPTLSVTPRLSIPACVCISGPIGRAAIGAVSAVQRGARVWVRTSGAQHGRRRQNLPDVVLHFHTVGEGGARQGKKYCPCSCYDADHFAHQSHSFNCGFPLPVDHVSSRIINPPGASTTS